MSLTLIQESAKEVRRLAIAGSPLAVGDFRLKKFIAPLEAAGGKVPVFAQVAKSIGEVVNGKEADSAANLLGLSTLLNAILYTQGQSGAAGDVRELEAFPTTCTSTRTPARVLKPLIEALTSSGGGRFEVIKAAQERGAFNDLRLIDPAIRALGDNYPELADLVAEKILPAFGPGILVRIKSTFDPKGKREHARRLQLMHQVDPAGTLELCKTSLEDGSPEVKAAAIACLGQHVDCLPLVLEQAKAKNKTLRAAALEALAAHDRPEVTTLFCELIKGDALDMLAGPFRILRSAPVLHALLVEGQRVFDLIFKGDGDHAARGMEILICLQARKDAEVEKFLLTNFARVEKLVKLKATVPKTPAVVTFATGVDLMDRLTSLLFACETPAAFEAVLAKREVLPPASFTHVFHSAVRTWIPEKVYDEFSGLLGQVKGAGKEKMVVLQSLIQATSGGVVWDQYAMSIGTPEVEPARLIKYTWDERWLDAGIKADLPAIVFSFPRPGHKGAVTYLLGLLETKAKAQGAAAARTMGQSGLAVRALVRCGYPKVTDCFLKAVAGKAKEAQYFDFDLQMLFASAKYLPAADLPKLDAFAAKLDEKFVDKYLEALAPLREVKS